MTIKIETRTYGNGSKRLHISSRVQNQQTLHVSCEVNERVGGNGLIIKFNGWHGTKAEFNTTEYDDVVVVVEPDPQV